MAPDKTESGSGVPPGVWVAIRDFARELEQDTELAARFEADPAAVLGERGIDLSLPEASGFRSLGEAMANMDPEARLATMDAFGALSGQMRVMAGPPDEPAVALTNANVFANANATNNANANNVANHTSNANTTMNASQQSNTSGASIAELGGPVLTQRVTVFDEFASSPVSEHLRSLRLTPARQLTLVKRIALDDDSLVESRRVGDGEFRLSRYAYRGDIIEVESLVTRHEVQILGARLV